MNYQTYSLVLCLIVFAMLTCVSVLVITIIYKQKLKLIRSGIEDEQLIAEYQKEQQKERKKLPKVLDYGLTLFLGLLVIIAFSLSVYIGCSQNTAPKNIPVYRVVKTDSMASRHPKNTYLETNNLNNQFRSMDLIKISKLPAESDLKLYDIVVYEVDGILIVHRIVGIEQPNTQHPDEYYFLLQGDAVESPDRFPVLYSQMKGIYYGEKLPFVGSFILFLQSISGWLCVLLVIVAIIVVPILEKFLKKEIMLRVGAPLEEKNEETEKSKEEENEIKTPC